jgi:hypothetical protein
MAVAIFIVVFALALYAAVRSVRSGKQGES